MWRFYTEEYIYIYHLGVPRGTLSDASTLNLFRKMMNLVRTHAVMHLKAIIA